MMTRRHIRIKVMQSIYSFNQVERQSIERQEKFLTKSIDTMFDLFLTDISLLLHIRKEAETYFRKSKHKRLATSEDKQPNTKFTDNAVWNLFLENEELNKRIEKRRINFWKTQPELVGHLWKQTRNSAIYKDYISTRDQSFKEDKDFFVEFFREIIAPDGRLYDFIEETKLTWRDDLPLVNTYILNLFKRLKPDSEQSYIFPVSNKLEMDTDFGKELLQKTLLHQEKFSDEFAQRTPNWDKDRIAPIDSILLTMAICEFLKFPSIPVKVSINEYLEIAKEYSTPKSSVFLNGVLDKLSKDFKNAGRLNKSGRGLM